jgi:hypothetical protein
MHPTPLSLTVRGYEMSPGRSLSRNSLTTKTTSAKAQKIENSTQNRLLKTKTTGNSFGKG